jgi:predicted DNA-binding antitoxin AbrB/MazE fold protein
MKHNASDRKAHIEYGFWSSDKFPFVLGSPGEMQADGWFKALSYGDGVFKPVKVLELQEGEALAAKLNELKAEYAAVQNSVYRGFKARLGHLALFAIKGFLMPEDNITAPELSSTATEPPKGRKSAGKRAGK